VLSPLIPRKGHASFECVVGPSENGHAALSSSQVRLWDTCLDGDSARATHIPKVIPFRIGAGRMFQLMSSANQS
jgi:hypothetical protein